MLKESQYGGPPDSAPYSATSFQSTTVPASGTSYQSSMQSSWQGAPQPQQYDAASYGTPQYDQQQSYGTPHYDQQQSYGTPQYDQQQSYGTPQYDQQQQYGGPQMGEQYDQQQQYDPAYDPAYYQQYDPTAEAMSRAEQIEQRNIRRLEKDTYACRRKEGRPKHSTSSITACVLCVLSFLMQFMAVWMTEWRIDWYGSFGYNERKSWGLFSVKGRTTQTWQMLTENTCKWWGSMRTFNSCQSPICHWYFVKCRTYTDMWMVSWSIGIAFIFGLIIHAVCTMFTFRMTPRALRWASIWWLVAVFIHITGLVIHFIVMEDLFSTLQNFSFYPDPDPGTSVIASCLSLFMLVIVVVLSYSLRWTWPEPTFSDSEDEIDDLVAGYEGYGGGRASTYPGAGGYPAEDYDKAPPIGFEERQDREDTRHGDDKAPQLK